MTEGTSEVQVVQVQDIQPVAGKLVTGHGFTVLVVVRPGETLLTHTAVHSLELGILVGITKLLAIGIHMILEIKLISIYVLD